MNGLHSPSQYEIARQIHDFWIKQGAKEIHAAALIGNTEGEDSLVPKLIGDHGQAFGIAQWHWRPRGAFIYENTGIDIRTADISDQLKAQAWEMQSPKSWYNKIWPNLLATQTLKDAVTVVVHQFEQSAQQDRDVMRRTELASFWLQYAKENYSQPPAQPPVGVVSVPVPLEEYGLPKLIWKPTPNFSTSKAKRTLIVIHDCQGGYEGAIATFLSQRRPRVSAHIVLKEDGSEATQMVAWSDVAWHSVIFNLGSIGLEMAGFAEKGFAQAEWSAEARMTAYLAHHFNIPIVWSKDGKTPGICRHFDLGLEGGAHTDPCTTDAPWLHFMSLVKAAGDQGGWPDVWGND